MTKWKDKSRLGSPPPRLNPPPTVALELLNLNSEKGRSNNLASILRPDIPLEPLEASCPFLVPLLTGVKTEFAVVPCRKQVVSTKNGENDDLHSTNKIGHPRTCVYPDVCFGIAHVSDKVSLSLGTRGKGQRYTMYLPFSPYRFLGAKRADTLCISALFPLFRERDFTGYMGNPKTHIGVNTGLGVPNTSTQRTLPY